MYDFTDCKNKKALQNGFYCFVNNMINRCLPMQVLQC